MKCFNCGINQNDYLCENCNNESIMEEVVEAILNYSSYNLEKCKNTYVLEYMSSFSNKEDIANSKTCILDILKNFSDDVTGYYYVLYYSRYDVEKFEKKAINYIGKNPITNIKTQMILYLLIQYYSTRDYEKPLKFCEMIKNTNDLCIELYLIAATYYAMVGDYDIAENLVEYAINNMKDIFLFMTEEDIETIKNRKIAGLKDLIKKIDNYRTKKPFWPSTEERRIKLAKIYDQKGINYPRISKKPKKIKESEFKKIIECQDYNLSNYTSFYCEYVEGIKNLKSIYQIAAVKVRDNKIVDEFSEIINPKDGLSMQKTAAKKLKVDLYVLKEARDIDLVMNSFFDFVGTDVLVSTEALGILSQLISRAARHSGMEEIKNEFLDILDYAADISDEFDFGNNNREYLIQKVKLEEGKNALQKARLNKYIYDYIKSLDV